MNRRYRSLLWQWTRQLWRRPAPVEIEAWSKVAPGQLAVTRGGHAMVVTRYHNLTVLFDPMLERFCKGVGRAEAVGINKRDLETIDLVLISNLAADHFHRPSIARLPKSATIVVPRGAARDLAGLKFDRVLELRPGQDFNHRGVDIATAPGTMGAIIYLLRGHGPSAVYCGASGACDAFSELGKRYQPDVALLPIGGYSPKSFRRRHLTPKTALDAFEALRARVFIPHRYGAFALSYETLEDPERWLTHEVGERELERFVEILRTGETQLLVPPRGRARTERGEARRPIGVKSAAESPSEGLDFDIDLSDGDDDASFGLQERDEDYDEIEVDSGVLAPGDESLQGL